MGKADDVFRLSKWVREYEKDGVIALFHILNIDVVFFSSELDSLISLLRFGTTAKHIKQVFPQYATELDSLIGDLSERGMIIPFAEDDAALLVAKRNKAIPPIGIETLYLLLTDSCNLQCSYCFILNGMPEGYRHNSMTWETAREAIDMFFANIRKNPPIYKKSLKTIHFYGGEPLVNFRLIQQVVDYVESTYAAEMETRGEEFIYSLVTNGTLIDEAKAVYFAAHPRINITISVDGQKETHDQKRVFQNGSGSFDDVLKGIRLLKSAGCQKLSLSCTIDDHNMDHLEDLLVFNDEFGLLSINLNPMLDTEQRRVTPEYMDMVSDRMIQYFQQARAVGIYEDRIMRKVKPFLSHRIHAYDCQATGHQLVCSPEGNLGVCHEGIGMKNYFFAPASSDFDFHGNPVVQEWGARTPLNMPQCYDCPALGICGGGCAYGAHLRNGSIWSVDDRFCQHSLKTLEWIIWDIYAQSA